MSTPVSNFSRFFAAFNELPYSGDREEFRRSIVSQYTWGRTESLREMTREEYDACCDGMEKLSGRKARMRQARSACLKLMQRMGIDTSDWVRVNDFCRHPRIMGKEFARIRLDEFPGLMRKLRAIQRGGGLRRSGVETPSHKDAVLKMVMVPIGSVSGEA